MKGDLLIHGQLYPGVYVYHTGDTSNTVVYMDDEDKIGVEECLSLIDSKVRINGEVLEISGYNFTGEHKGFPVDRPINREPYEYIEAHFIPFEQIEMPGNGTSVEDVSRPDYETNQNNETDTVNEPALAYTTANSN